ncbi:hypothetical protein J3R83DRAFT_986 [Lanmaoa asiatica]|nr:hypothetical protein J3R83DRAFT_986 [Lanmaoa asiatica]
MLRPLTPKDARMADASRMAASCPPAINSQTRRMLAYINSHLHLRMPFNMFKAFSGSRNRTHRGDPSIYTDYPQGYPPATIKYKGKSCSASGAGPPLTHQLQRREPVFTPLPSRTPTDADDYNEGYIRVDSPDAVMGGALNARPAKIASAFPSGLGVESPVSETLSEREHREHAVPGRLHDVPRLLDRPPQLQHAGSFHNGRGEQVDHNEPIVMSPSPSRSSASGSDHTIEALRTPPSMYPSERVIPPLPRNYSGGYVPGSRSPTDIYGSHPYEVVHDVHSHHKSEVYLDGHGRAGGYDKGGPIYYIIPGGMDVIFQDEHGNEITRVGDFSGRPRPSRPDMIVPTEDLIEGIVNLRSFESILTPLPASSGVTHPTATALTPRIGGVMIITQIIESIAITEKKTGVITEITGTEVTLTTQTIVNTEITEATGIPAHTEITEVTENMVDTETTETTEFKEGRRCTLQTGCPLERRIGHIAMRVSCL